MERGLTPLQTLTTRDGNRYWDKKQRHPDRDATCQGSRLRDRDTKQQNGQPVPVPEQDAEDEIRRYERQAKELVARLSPEQQVRLNHSLRSSCAGRTA